MTLTASVERGALTPEQRAIVEAGDGPIVVIAGAGTGKTRVIVERVRWLLATKGDLAVPRAVAAAPRPPTGPRDNPFAGPLLPEQVLVLTYNVKAAKELSERIDEAVGPAIRARMTVSNFHSFCQRILTECSSDAGLPPRPEVLDGVDQMLLLQGLRGDLDLRYHSDWSFTDFVTFINRAKDELVGPDDFDAFVAGERAAYEREHGSYAEAELRLEAQGNLAPLRKVRSAYAARRAQERAAETAGDVDDATGARLAALLGAEGEVVKTADREARRTLAGNGRAAYRGEFEPEDRPRIDSLAESYVRDGAALEILRLTELARVYHAYEDALAARGALDFGEQIALVTRLFKTRPNVLRRWQRQYRYLLVDEFQDANVAQIELIELLGRTPDRPDNVMVVGDDDQSIYRFRGASYAAFAELDARFSRPPAHDPHAAPPGLPRRLRIEQNFRSVAHVLRGANRLIAINETRFEPDKRLWTDREDGTPIELLACAGPEDEAVAIADAICRLARPPCAGSTVLSRGEGSAHNSHMRMVPTTRNDLDAGQGGAQDASAVDGVAVDAGSPSDHPEVLPLGWNDPTTTALGDARPADGVRFELSDVAILYRKHKHRDAIVERLRAEDIPYTVVGGLSLFEAPEIRDLEQGLRAIADPHDDVAVVRMMTAGPWRLDALEIARVTRAAEFDGPHLLETAKALVAREDGALAPETRAKLRALLATIEALNPQTWRDGPFSILERYLERTGQVLDLLSVGTLEAKRSVANIASFMRFVADWQQENPSACLADFVRYLDAYRSAGGELPTSVELSEDVDGVRLMTLYQAKGLEFPVVIVPSLLDGEWPVKEQGDGWFPRELLREDVPAGDIHTDEERRLLYVAMTRAQERLILATHADPQKAPSRFIGELLDGAGPEIRRVDRTAVERAGDVVEETAEGEAFEGDANGAGSTAAFAAARRIMPLPTSRERRLALRLRAAELVGLMESTSGADPEAAAARDALAAQLASVGRIAAASADETRAAGLDPLTVRTLALDSAAGANLLLVAPLPSSFSYTSLSAYEACPLRYAFQYVYRMPEHERPVAPYTFGHIAHEAFEAFTRERRERQARGEPGPSRADLGRLFRDRWVPTEFGDRVTEAGYARRVDNLLDRFWAGEVSTLGEAIAEELAFELVLDPGDGSAPVVVHGEIDRIDRLPSGGIEVIDYKTGSESSQKDVRENLQLTIYALACRDALGLGTPERVTLYFTESGTRMSTTRTDEQLDLARAEILARVGEIRSGNFAAMPGRPCQWCDYRAMCPEAV